MVLKLLTKGKRKINKEVTGYKINTNDAASLLIPLKTSGEFLTTIPYFSIELSVLANWPRAYVHTYY